MLAAIHPLRDAEHELVARALAHDPSLALRRAELEASRHAIVVREWERVPSFALGGTAMGSGAVDLSAALTLPFLRGTAIEASIRQAEAELRAAEALLRQSSNDATANVLANLAGLRALEAEALVFRDALLPRLFAVQGIARANWSIGGGELSTFAESLTASIEVERALVRSRARHAIARARLAEQLGRLPELAPER